MNYCVFMRVKTSDNEWMTLGRSHNISWEVRDLVVASSGWSILNEDTVGSASALVSKLQKGILELTLHPDNYVRYEVSHGMGTIKDVLQFYQSLVKDCREYPFTEVYGSVV